MQSYRGIVVVLSRYDLLYHVSLVIEGFVHVACPSCALSVMLYVLFLVCSVVSIWPEELVTMWSFASL